MPFNLRVATAAELVFVQPFTAFHFLWQIHFLLDRNTHQRSRESIVTNLDNQRNDNRMFSLASQTVMATANKKKQA